MGQPLVQPSSAVLVFLVFAEVLRHELDLLGPLGDLDLRASRISLGPGVVPSHLHQLLLKELRPRLALVRKVLLLLCVEGDGCICQSAGKTLGLGRRGEKQIRCSERNNRGARGRRGLPFEQGPAADALPPPSFQSGSPHQSLPEARPPPSISPPWSQESQCRSRDTTSPPPSSPRTLRYPTHPNHHHARPPSPALSLPPHSPSSQTPSPQQTYASPSARSRSAACSKSERSLRRP
mmetsp:Transcript_4515/g.13394  ORF Transcript_4515/g.13394 Transcript_4515/m.13394 type:complete len:236 (+) Transcript_4515:2181-2888(+)